MRWRSMFHGLLCAMVVTTAWAQGSGGGGGSGGSGAGGAGGSDSGAGANPGAATPRSSPSAQPNPATQPGGSPDVQGALPGASSTPAPGAAGRLPGGSPLPDGSTTGQLNPAAPGQDPATGRFTNSPQSTRPERGLSSQPIGPGGSANDPTGRTRTNPLDRAQSGGNRGVDGFADGLGAGRTLDRTTADGRARGSTNAADPNYRWHNDNWWYRTPNGWLFWYGDRWVNYDRNTYYNYFPRRGDSYSYGAARPYTTYYSGPSYSYSYRYPRYGYRYPSYGYGRYNGNPNYGYGYYPYGYGRGYYGGWGGRGVRIGAGLGRGRW